MIKMTAMNILSKMVTNISFNQNIFGQQAIYLNKQNKHHQSLKNIKSQSFSLQNKQQEKKCNQEVNKIVYDLNNSTNQSINSLSVKSQIQNIQQQSESYAVSSNLTQIQNINYSVYQKNICQCRNSQKCKWIQKWLTYNKNNSLPFQRQIKTSAMNQINKDVPRTIILFPKQKKNQIKQNLKKALILYCFQDPQICYIQGFNNIMGTFLSHSKSITQAFYLFRFLLQQRYFRVLYIKNFQYAKKHSVKICKALSKKQRKLYDHLIFQLKIDLSLFIIGWIIPLFTNIIPNNLITQVFDGLFQYSWVFLYTLCLQIFIQMKQQILNQNDKQQAQSKLIVKSMKKITKWREIISEALITASKLDSSFASPY